MGPIALQKIFSHFLKKTSKHFNQNEVRNNFTNVWFSPLDLNFDLISIVGVQVKRIQGILNLSLIFFAVFEFLYIFPQQQVQKHQQQQQQPQQELEQKQQQSRQSKEQVKAKQGLLHR